MASINSGRKQCHNKLPRRNDERQAPRRHKLCRILSLQRPQTTAYLLSCPGNDDEGSLVGSPPITNQEIYITEENYLQNLFKFVLKVALTAVTASIVKTFHIKKIRCWDFQ